MSDIIVHSMKGRVSVYAAESAGGCVSPVVTGRQTTVSNGCLLLTDAHAAHGRWGAAVHARQRWEPVAALLGARSHEGHQPWDELARKLGVNI